MPLVASPVPVEEAQTQQQQQQQEASPNAPLSPPMPISPGLVDPDEQTSAQAAEAAAEEVDSALVAASPEVGLVADGTINEEDDFDTMGWPDDKPAAAAPLLSSASCLLYTSPSPRDRTRSRMPSSA